jgi:hypothetical protein
MRTATGWIVRELGIELQDDSGTVMPLNYGISMSRRDLDAVQSATGVTSDVVSAMLLPAYGCTVLDLSSLGHGPAGDQVGAREWGCSADHGAVRTAWRPRTGYGRWAGLRPARSIRYCSTASALDAGCRCGGAATGSRCAPRSPHTGCRLA